MNYSIDRERKKRTIYNILISGFVLGLMYPVFADGFSNPIAYINGISIGVIGAFFVAIIEIYGFKPRSEKYSFLRRVITKSLVYFFLFLFLILVIMNTNESLYYHLSFLENFLSERFQNFLFKGDFKVILLYDLFFVAIIIFTRELSRKMGQGVFWNYLTGKYYYPREEERIFMYIDQKSSTAITEKMSSMEYYKLLKEFYFDITKCVLSAYGRIYRYVGDQLVVSWSVKNGLKNANCIRCYFYIRSEIENQKEKYLAKYGFVPDFRVSMHLGEVIHGEIGDVKSQIVFHGEALYETVQIENECRTQNKDFLVSESIVQRISIPVIYTINQCSSIPISKSGKLLNLYSIEEAELESV